MLTINSINKGIVIDHIKAGHGHMLYEMLDLDKADYSVALIMNANSKAMGRKDIIKIENVIDLDLRVLGLIDETITVNIIEDQKIVKKINVELPEVVEDVIHCKNPRCISTSERNIVHRFELIDREQKLYKCAYCDQIYDKEE
ncbi:aspartate carbamoyltransferase regulatory subunit [Lagierella massiliensis]|uniref:aspartate carbamoyltransferase regulatory subunit n=1 Tax=Lagierella massiliensis TaxID=1689303 RepID=UPI0006D81EEF|nr:aspartate carbamoyltransferase regulatory subunit [Lagierella massiliensis]